jgi:hypothetical protein
LICPLIDPRLIGKHYLVDSQVFLGNNLSACLCPLNGGKLGVKRHYTSAYSMKHDIFENILKIA